MKKFTTIVGSVALLAAAVIPAIAAGNNCGNATSGPLSTNYCTINNTSTVTVNNVNDAQINNRVTATSNTGGNTASYNTLGGSISTGNATLNATVSNVANVNTTTVTGGPAAGSNTGVNEITGPSSYNQAAINNVRVVAVENSNTATVNNTVNATADTGNNHADFNTGPAEVRSGNALLNVGVGTHVNDSATAVSAGAGGSTGNTVGNSTTGPLSNNFATLDNINVVRVNNINDLIVDNTVDALANTGRNSASFNTLGGAIGTGSAAAGVGVETIGNVNTTTIEAAMGGFVNDASNGVTGPMSLNQTAVNNNQVVDVENWNNKCRSHNAPRLGDEECDVADLGVFNYDQDVADTGNNHGDFNTGASETATGWTNLWKDISTRLNDTLTVIK